MAKAKKTAQERRELNQRASERSRALKNHLDQSTHDKLYALRRRLTKGQENGKLKPWKQSIKSKNPGSK